MITVFRRGCSRRLEPRLVLASASPRRARILRELGVPFRVVVSNEDESLLSGEDGAAAVERLARAKALAVARGESPAGARRRHRGPAATATSSASPRTSATRSRCCGAWPGRAHEVVTGVCLVSGGVARSGVERSIVRFAPMSDGELALVRGHGGAARQGGRLPRGRQGRALHRDGRRLAVERRRPARAPAAPARARGRPRRWGCRGHERASPGRRCWRRCSRRGAGAAPGPARRALAARARAGSRRALLLAGARRPRRPRPRGAGRSARRRVAASPSGAAARRSRASASTGCAAVTAR